MSDLIGNKPNKLSLLLLAVTPLLIIIQFIISIVLIGIIVRTNESENERSRLEVYLRNNLVYLINAETGQRGYLLTGKIEYLQPYKDAIEQIKENEKLSYEFAGSEQNEHLANIRAMSDRKLQELAFTIKLYTEGNRDSALSVVNSNVGNLTMDSIRRVTNSFLSRANETVAALQAREYRLIRLFLLAMAFMFLFQLFFAYYAYRKLKEHNNSILALIHSLEQSNTDLKNYTNMSYHELKTPLRNIAGFLQILQKKYKAQLDEEAREFVNIIIHSVKQMNQAIDKLRRNYLEKDE